MLCKQEFTSKVPSFGNLLLLFLLILACFQLSHFLSALLFLYLSLSFSISMSLICLTLSISSSCMYVHVPSAYFPPPVSLFLIAFIKAYIPLTNVCSFISIHNIQIIVPYIARTAPISLYKSNSFSKMSYFKGGIDVILLEGRYYVGCLKRLLPIIILRSMMSYLKVSHCSS